MNAVVIRTVVDQVSGRKGSRSPSRALMPTGKEPAEVKRLWREIQKVGGYQRIARSARLDPTAVAR